MSGNQVFPPFQVFTDTDGEPLDAGFIYLGEAFQNPQVTPTPAFWDPELTIPAAQPIRTIGGYPSRNGTPSRVYVGLSIYSITVRNQQGELVFNLLDAQDSVESIIGDPTDPNAGAALIARGDQIVNSIAALRLLNKNSASQYAFVTGYYTAGDGGGGHYYLDAADAVSADNGGTIIVAADGARWKLVVEGGVSTRQFGSNGTSTDTERCQAAIDWCLSFPRAVPLIVSGRCLINSPLKIDRQVDTTTSEFRIIADGTDSGFHADDASITFFDSNLPMPGVDPVSEFVTFEGIQFTASSTGLNCNVLTHKFLRIKFLNCYFRQVKCVTATTYLQSYYFTNCNIRMWPGVFLFATHAFDIDFNGCISEFGLGYLANLSAGCYNVRFRGGVHEGSVGGLITAGRAESLLITGYYMEGNNQKSLQFNAGDPNESVAVIGCFFASTDANIADTSFFEIEWGATRAGASIGNHQENGRLHDNGIIPAVNNSAPRLFSQGDTAFLELSKQPLFLDQSSGNFSLNTGIGTGTITAATFRRNGNLCSLEFNLTFSGTSGSSAQLVGLPFAGQSAIFGGDVVFTTQTGGIFLMGGAGLSGIGGTATSLLVTKDLQGTPYTYTELNGKVLVGSVSYFI